MIPSDSIKVVAFDLDGTIYQGNDLIDGADSVVEYVRGLGYHVIFLTNNSTKSREEIHSKLQGMGISCSIDDVYNSGHAAALFVQSRGLSNVYVSGSDGLKKEFTDLGITVSDKSQTLVIGYNQAFDYDMLTDVVNIALNAEYIIACNKERTYPGTNGKRMPGCGAMVSAVEWCSNRISDYVVGKPNKLMLDIIAEKYGLHPSEFLVVGDTYESDIIMANAAGASSILITNSAYADTVCIKSIKEIYNHITTEANFS